MVPVQTSDPQSSDATKVGQYKRRTYKRRTGTNVGRVQTSDWYKRRTGSYLRKNVRHEKNAIAIRNKLKITHLL